MTTKPAAQPARVALVTGGGGGVGRAVAVALARMGCDVAVLGRNADPLSAAVAEVERTGRRAISVEADVTDRAAVDAAVSRTRERLGPITVLVGAAGIAEAAPLLPPDDALFDRTMSVNVRGAWVATTAVLPDLLAAKRGRIVHVASTAGLVGYRYTAAYVASKHALVGLVRAWALDLMGKGITVNAVCPGFLDTPMTQRTLDRIVATTGRTKEEALADLLKTAGQESLIPPDEVASAVAALCRDEASDVTGSTVGV
jgi:3-hydroxybutyrate dehydrogenase